MTRASWLVRLLARSVARPYRDLVLDDVLDDYRAAVASGTPARRARRRGYIDLIRSGIDTRYQAWLERRAVAGGRRAWTLSADLRAAWRQHRRQPAGTVSALLTIALAIGVNTTLVSVVRSTLMRPLPFRDPGQIVFIWDAQAGRPRLPLTPARALDFRSRPASIASGASIGHTAVTVTGLGPAERWSGASVSASFFDVLEANAALGRTFHAADRDRDVVVLSHRLWSQRFGADPAVVGRTLMMNGHPRTIAGVMSEDFFWPVITSTPSAANGPDFWACAPVGDTPEGPIPTIEDKPRYRQSGYVRLVARLSPKVSLAAAQTELSAVAESLAREYPATDGGHTVVVVPLAEQFFGSVREPLLFLLLASLLVVVLACVNVANLLVMRLPARGRELAIRVALGASRLRLARLLLIEGVMLAVGGGVAGIALARLSLRAVAGLAPPGVGHLDRLGLDAGVLAATASAVLGCALVLGLLPAVVVWRSRPAHDLRAAGAAPGTRPRLRQALVALEVAVALALVVGATLFGQSLLRLRRVDVGFETRGLLTFDIVLVGERAEYQSKQVTFFEDMLRAIRAVPGVTSAGGAVTLPIGGDDFAAPFYAEGRPKPAPGQEPHVGLQLVGAHWFETLGMRIVSGRDFTEQDNRRDAPVAMVNQTLATRMWPGESPVGKRFRYESDPTVPWLTVVGVITDIRHLGPASPPRPEFYEPVPPALPAVSRGGGAHQRRPVESGRADPGGGGRSRSGAADFGRRHDVGSSDARVR